MSQMITSRKGRTGRFALLLLVCLALIGYFSYHAVEGKHGLHRRAALEKKIAHLEEELANLKQERKKIEHDVSLLTTRVRKNPDVLTEQAKTLLNYTNPDDFVVLRPSNTR
jgi:cell division protein FtsB